MNVPPLTVELLIGRSFDIWLHSYFVTGLVQLAQERALCLRIVRAPDSRNCRSSVVLAARCRQVGNPVVRMVCFDPLDHSNGWNQELLMECDVYFKRSFFAPHVAELPAIQQAKVRPLNPIFATWCRDASGWAARLYVAHVLALMRHAAGQQPAHLLSSALRALRHFTSLSTLDHYEDSCTSPKRPQVLFQTRLWDPATETEDWVAACNQHRVHLVRQLRKALGDRLVGGLVRTPYAEKQYPELLSNLTPTATAKRPTFIRLCREFLIRVNISALFDAVPYSLGETLAANNCLVSEPIRNLFATPLVPDREFLRFDHPEQCAELCQRLLANPEQAQQLRRNQQQYYQHAVNPKQAMGLYLQQVFKAEPVRASA